MITFILDCTSGVKDWKRSVDSVVALPDGNIELLIAYSESSGACLASEVKSDRLSVSTVRVGNGLGVGNWQKTALLAKHEFLCFLRPGDTVSAPMIEELPLEKSGDWVIGAWKGSRYSDWWQRDDMASSPSALILLGVVFPECAAIVGRADWLKTYEEYPDTKDDYTRASTWLYLSLNSPPRICESEFCYARHPTRQVQTNRISSIVANLSESRLGEIESWIRGLGRIGSGLRTGYAGLLEVLPFAEDWIGPLGNPSTSRGDWLEGCALLDLLLRRGRRPVWIWGAGGRGLEALAWLAARSIPLEGFIDSNPARESESLESFPIIHSKRFLSREEEQKPIVVIASMYHVEIASELSDSGYVNKMDFAVYSIPLSFVEGVSR